MPARKSPVAVMPHFQAVRLAPESELKQKLVAEAEAEYRRGFGASLDRSIEALTNLLTPPQPDPMDFEQRPVAALTAAQTLRLNAQLARMILERDRRLEAAYQFARTLVFQATGVRVGERFWTLELQAQQALEQMQKAQQATQDAAPETAAAPGPVQADSQPGPQTPAVAAPCPQKPVSNKQIKSTIRRLRQAKVSPELCEALRQTAQAGQWSLHDLEQAANQLLAA